MDVECSVTTAQKDGNGYGPVEENRSLKTIIDAAPAMIAYWDSNLRCRHANRAYIEWFGMAPEKVVGKHMTDVLGGPLFKLNEPYILGALGGQAQRFERTLTKADGSVGYTLANYVPDVDSNGRVAGFSVLVSDVTPLKLAEFQAAKAQARLSAVLDSVLDGIITIEADWTISSINPAGLRMFGYQSDDVLGKALSPLFASARGLNLYVVDGEEVPAELVEALTEVKELTGLRSDGQRFPVELRISKVEGIKENLYVGLVRDITLQWSIHEQLSRFSREDGLTGLANRRHFDEVLAIETIAHARSGNALSLILIDVDFFKQFNDQYGHVAGDHCLQQVAKAIGRTMTRATDLAARYGGEEFACILPSTSLDGAVLIARQIQNEVAKLGLAHARSSVADHVTVSIGIVTVHCNTRLSSEKIINLADAQLYAAKSKGRNQFSAVQTDEADGTEQ